MATQQPAAEQTAGCCASILSHSAAVAPKLHTAYHLLLGREQLRAPLLHTTTALTALRGSVLVREAWTDVGSHGVGRTADLTRRNKTSDPGHPGLDPVTCRTSEAETTTRTGQRTTASDDLEPRGMTQRRDITPGDHVRSFPFHASVPSRTGKIHDVTPPALL